MTAALAAATVGGASEADAGSITMHRVLLYNFDDAAVTIGDLEGELKPTRKGGTVDLNDVDSYGIDIHRSTVLIPPATMTILMNRFILPRAGSPLSDMKMVFGEGVIHLHGRIRAAGLKLGFTADAFPFVTPRGDVGMRIAHLKTAGFIPASVSNALGLTLEKMAKPSNPGIMDVRGDVMTISVAHTFPAPALNGKLSALRVTPAGMTTRIGAKQEQSGPPQIRISGGEVKFAHLIMPNAKLVILPEHKQSYFGFSPRRYYRQMVAGTSKATADYGLIGYFSDFRALRQDVGTAVSQKRD